MDLNTVWFILVAILFVGFFFLEGFDYGVGILLPFSRAQESEADRMGINFMAIAGYDPRASIGLWQRMAAAAKGAGKPPVFLSTHPSDEQRIERLKQDMPEALKRYEKATGKPGKPKEKKRSK